MIEVGQTIGNYKITAKLGEGGMGVVYLAEHPVIGRKVALKAIHPELSRNPEVVSRFMTEAKSVNQIGNEHIVDVSDFGNTPEGEFYFIMEFLQGESVADRLRRERLFDTNRALQIAAQVADALYASHSQGIIHRDLKPENIFLITRGQNRDFVKVLDFGLAKLTLGEEKVSHKTRTGSVMGTPYYMAPEQCEGKAGVDYRADIYSLGVILFEMMTGSVPFGGEGYGEIIVKHLTQQPPPPRALNPAVSPAQEAVVMRALAKAREARFNSMEEFRTAMLNPEEFARGRTTAVAVATPAAAPAGSPAGEAGPTRRLSPPGTDTSGPRRVPVPSTFRHGIGELLDEEPPPARSRKGLVVGGLLAAAVAAVGAVVYVKRQSSNELAQQAAVAAKAAEAAAVPRKVRISFSSIPEGATVTLKDTGEVLGATPLEKDVPYGTSAVAVVFAKDGFEQTEIPLVPRMASMLNANLRPAPPPVVTPPVPAVAEKPAKPPVRKAAASPKPKKPATKPLDDDAVLEPKF
jgi:eukaryotic-like serine/threonine-protein kinase